MSEGPLEFKDVTFVHDSAASPIREGLSVRFDRGWTGIIGPNGAGKTTLLRPAADRPDRWDTLSHGERKRAQIAVALWRDPRVPAVDEPANHIDLPARRMLAAAARRMLLRTDY